MTTYLYKIRNVRDQEMMTTVRVWPPLHSAMSSKEVSLYLIYNHK